MDVVVNFKIFVLQTQEVCQAILYLKLLLWLMLKQKELYTSQSRLSLQVPTIAIDNNSELLVWKIWFWRKFEKVQPSIEISSEEEYTMNYEYLVISHTNRMRDPQWGRSDK